MAISVVQVAGPAGVVRLKVAGSTGSWSLRATRASGVAAGGWGLVATGSGNGPQDVPAATFGSDGGYFVYGQDTAGVGVPVYVIVDAAVSDPWERMLVAIRDEVEGLALEGVEPERIVSQKVPVDRYLLKTLAAHGQGVADESPGVLVSPEPERRNQRDQLNRQLQTDYRARVSMFRGNGGDPASWRGQQLKWRNRIVRHFNQQTLPAVPEVQQVLVEPGEVFPFAPFQRLSKDVQSVVLVCVTCEV